MVKKNVLSLTPWERIVLYNFMSQQARGDLGYIRRSLAVMEVLELSEEEKAEIQYEQVDAENAKWGDAKREFELAFGRSELLVLKPVLEAKWPVNRLYLALLEKVEEAIG